MIGLGAWSVWLGPEKPCPTARDSYSSYPRTGPNNERDYVGIGTADVTKRPYITYEYTRNGSPISLNAPDEPGDYELRYFLGQGNKIVGSRRITVGGVTASDKALSQAMRTGFEIVNVQGQAVAEGLAGGEPVRVMPGNYSVRIKGQPNRAQPVTVRPKETATVRF